MNPGLGLNISLPGGNDINVGWDDVQQVVSGVTAGDRDAHISFQNKAGQDLASIVAQYQSAKAARRLTTAAIQSAINAVYRVVNDFQIIVGRINTDRAMRGLADIQRLGQQIAASMQADSITLGGNVPSYNPGLPDTAVDPTTGTVYLPQLANTGLFGNISPTMMLMLGIGAVLLLRKK